MDSITTALTDLFAMPEYILEIGVQEGKTKRKQIQLGITNAQLMFIHEHGSPLRHLPARPVLQMTIDWAISSNVVSNTWIDCINDFFENNDVSRIDQKMNKLALKLQNYARMLIRDKKLAPNAASTIARKHSDTPLIDTGQLSRAITCIAIRIK